MIHHSSYSKGSSIPTEEGDPAAIQIAKGSLYVVQGSEQVGLVTGDPVQLQVQKGYAWKIPPAPKKSIITFQTLFCDHLKNLHKPSVSEGASAN